jgi:hypothetical protein
MLMAHISTKRDVAIVCLFVFGAVAIVLGALRCSTRVSDLDTIEIRAEPSPLALPLPTLNGRDAGDLSR